MEDQKLNELLYFVWRWKVVSTKALTFKFFNHCAPNTAYNTLLKLRHERLLTIMSDAKGENYGFTLDKKGFSILKSHLPALRSDGFRSENFKHDFTVTAVHLGEWVNEMPQGSKFFTEQELRRIHFDHYPPWAPKPPVSQNNKDYLHTPDGYWNLPFGHESVTLALEVELNLKTHARYRSIFKFYADHPGIFRVIWLVPKTSWASALGATMRTSPFAKTDIHNFISLAEFQKCGWGASVFHGPELGRSLFSLLHLGNGNTPGTFPAFLHLDPRKSPHKSTTSRLLNLTSVVV